MMEYECLLDELICANYCDS